MNSIWTEPQSLNIKQFDTLNGNFKTDVLIIGGGIAGVLCAHFLSEQGRDCVLLEGGRIGMGITKNTTAKITSQHGLIYQDLLKKSGTEKAKMYLIANELAVQKFAELCKDKDCDFEEKDAFIYSLKNREKIEKEVAAVHKIGHKAEFLNELPPLPFHIEGAVKFERQAQFHPLKFVAKIAEPLQIFENTFVTELQGNTAITKHGKITANHIIIATHFPFLNKHGSYFLKLYQHRSYAIALKGAKDVEGMYLEETSDGMSFRNYKDLLIIGGGDHKTGKKGGNFEILRYIAENSYPGSSETAAWATQDCISLDNIPYIGRYSASLSNIYVASGFNKWGMTSSMVAALTLTDMINEKGDFLQYAPVFSPSRSMLNFGLIKNILGATVNLLTPTVKRCPHMGCALKWNKVERTWDCPCHGSRFCGDGELIDNPAKKGLKFKK